MRSPFLSLPKHPRTSFGSFISSISSSFTNRPIRRWLSTETVKPIDNNPHAITPFIEQRTYVLKSEGYFTYLENANRNIELRKRLFPGFLGFFTTDTGGDLLSVTHFYYYPGGFHERDAVTANLIGSPDWREYMDEARPHIVSQNSRILLEATDVYNVLPAMAGKLRRIFVLPCQAKVCKELGKEMR